LSNWIGSNWSHRSTLPLQFLLSGWAEAHLDYGSEIIPLRLLQKGDLFGAFELCDTLAGIAAEPPPWSVSSGARSVVIQASVGDRRIRKALAEDLEESLTTLPDPITRPWEFARLVACKKSLNWQSRVFFIPADWIFSDAEISYPLRLYVALASWTQSAFLRLNVADDTVDLKEQKLLVPYHTARHLRLVARGEAPAFRLIRTDEPGDAQAGPFKELRTLVENVLSEAEMYHNVLVLQPSHLRTIGASGYYSWSRPTLLGPRLPPSPRNHADSLHNVWDHIDEIHGKGRPYLDLEKTTIHTPFETSESRTHRKRAGLGLPTYLRQDLGLPAEPDPVFRLRNSKGEGSFFAACIRVVRL
jgi:hypothetical protein